MTEDKKLCCPFCGAEIQTRKLLTGMVDYVCINSNCDFAYTPLPMKWWQSLIDGKRAQDALNYVLPELNIYMDMYLNTVKGPFEFEMAHRTIKIVKDKIAELTKQEE